MKQLLFYTLPPVQCNAQARFDQFGMTMQKETFEHITRVQADGGVVYDILALDRAIAQAKADGTFNQMPILASPIYGIKKDASEYTGTLYNVRYNVSDVNWVLNGDFSTSGTGAERWTLNNQTIADGVCRFNSLGAGNTLSKYSYQYDLESGVAYKIVFTIKNYVSGAIQAGLTDKSTITQVWGPSVSGNGIHSCDIVCPGSGNDGTLYFNPTGSSNTFDLDDVKVYKIFTSDLMQTTGANQPLYVENGQNGKPVIRFDGVNDYLKTALMTLNQPMAVYLGVKQLSWTSGDRIYTGFNAYCDLIQDDSPLMMMYSGYYNPRISNDVRVFQLIKTVHNGVSSSIQINNNTPVTGSTGTNNPNGFTLGAFYTGTNGANIDVAEIRVLNAIPNTIQDTSIKTVINSTWGIY